MPIGRQLEQTARPFSSERHSGPSREPCRIHPRPICGEGETPLLPVLLAESSGLPASSSSQPLPAIRRRARLSLSPSPHSLSALPRRRFRRNRDDTSRLTTATVDASPRFPRR